MSTGHWVRALFVALMAMGMTTGALVSPADAAKYKATATIKNTRVVVKFTGGQPTRASIKVVGKTYRLKKAKKVWRTKSLKAGKLAAMAGKKARIKARIKGKNRVIKATVKVAAPPSADEPTAPPTAPPAAPPATPVGLFAAPGVDRIGNDAWEAIKGYFLDSTFTNCPGGWSTCGAEERYGHFANYTTVYCRLSAIGGDITNYPKPMEIIGAEQKADGSWGVSYYFDYGDGGDRVYTWYVQPDGSASGRYWYNRNPNTDAPTEVMTGMVWLRGAKDCTY